MQLRAKYIKLFNHLTIDNYASAEIAFAKYIRFCGATVERKFNNLDIECSFGEELTSS